MGNISIHLTSHNGGQRRAKDPVRSPEVYNRTIVNKNESVLYYLRDGPKRGLVRKDLSLVLLRNELPPEGIRLS